MEKYFEFGTFQLINQIFKVKIAKLKTFILFLDKFL